MTLRTFEHALTGRSVQVSKDSRIERLVEADDNWSEIKPKSTSKKEADSGSGNADGRRGGSRTGADSDGAKPRRKSARKG